MGLQQDAANAYIAVRDAQPTVEPTRLEASLEELLKLSESLNDRMDTLFDIVQAPSRDKTADKFSDISGITVYAYIHAAVSRMVYCRESLELVISRLQDELGNVKIFD